MKLKENKYQKLKNNQKNPRNKKAYLYSIFFLSLTAFALTQLPERLNLWINISTSIPYGIYRKVEKYPQKDDYILFCLKGETAKITVRRHYTVGGNCPFQSAPIGKKVVASQGDHVKISYSGIEVNGYKVPLTEPSNYDSKKRRMPEFAINRYLDNGEYIVASSKENSYDSRYFGVIKNDEIKGVIERIIPS